MDMEFNDSNRSLGCKLHPRGRHEQFCRSTSRILAIQHPTVSLPVAITPSNINGNGPGGNCIQYSMGPMVDATSSKDRAT